MKQNMRDFVSFWKFWSLMFGGISLFFLPVMGICSILKNDYMPILGVGATIVGTYILLNFLTFVLSLFGLCSCVERGSCG